MVKTRRLFLKDKDGQSLIEFALVLPILLLVVFGITELGRAIMVTSVLNAASREGARLAAVSTEGDSLSVQGKVLEILDAANPPIVAKEITIRYVLDQDIVEVTVTTEFEVVGGGIFGIFDLIIPDPFLLTGRTVMRYITS